MGQFDCHRKHPAGFTATSPGRSGYAEVIIQYNQSRGFSGIFGSGALPVSGRAVACGSVGDVGIMCLDDVVTESAQICGKVNILNGGQIYINSNGTIDEHRIR